MRLTKTNVNKQLSQTRKLTTNQQNNVDMGISTLNLYYPNGAQVLITAKTYGKTGYISYTFCENGKPANKSLNATYIIAKCIGLDICENGNDRIHIKIEDCANIGDCTACANFILQAAGKRATGNWDGIEIIETENK